MFWRTFRARLFIYSTILIIFLSATLFYSYRYSHDVIMTEADNHLFRLQQLLDGHLAAERNELQRYTTILSLDLRLKEYMFVVTGIGGDSKALQTLYDRVFGWLPIDRKIILDNDGHILIGNNNTDLAIAVRNNTTNNNNRFFYFQGKTGLEIAAVSPIKYRDKILGKVAVTRHIDQSWLNTNKAITGGEFFLVQNKNIISSTLNSLEHSPFNVIDNRITVNRQPYHLYQINLPGKNQNPLQLWFGLSEVDIVNRLQGHQQFILILALSGIAAILIISLVMIRNFTRPLLQLTHATSEISKGNLPLFAKSQVHNEFDVLSNHFADMIHSLRDKQDEIDKTHAILEQSAITDTLTGTYNRRYLQEVFPKLMAQARREGFYVYALMFDLDHFKKINDTFGHIAGDQCLTYFSQLLLDNSRTSDYVFRLGGEEFLILMISENITTATHHAEKIRQMLEHKPVTFNEQTINMTVSGGVSYARPENSTDKTLNQMLSRADVALYEAKNEGRNRIHQSNKPEDTGAFDSSKKAV